MAYDEAFAQRVREALAVRGASTEIKMFGGLCFTVRGHMTLGVLGRDLMARVGPEAYERALRKSGARPMDFTGRPLTGFVLVAPNGTRTRAALDGWRDMALAYVSTLPPRTAQRRRPVRSRGRRA